jgi:hypothetical protein
VAGQVDAVPPQTYGAHEGAPAPVTTVQVPSAEAPREAAQTSQASPQVELQHFPSEQWVVVHWLSPEQVPPPVIFGTHWWLALQ